MPLSPTFMSQFASSQVLLSQLRAAAGYGPAMAPHLASSWFPGI
jgi:hypothetical protein